MILFDYMLHESPLLRNRESMTDTRGLLGAFLHLCHYTVSRIFADNLIPDRKLEHGVQQCMNAFQGVRLQALLVQQIIVELKHIGNT